jgi:hypothetical protein
VKELARYAGKQFVLYNCTESLDVTAIVKILAGAVSTGAWACFDEFNRLQQGVLSVLAKHIIAIQTELVAGSGRVNKASLFKNQSQSEAFVELIPVIDLPCYLVYQILHFPTRNE